MSTIASLVVRLRGDAGPFSAAMRGAQKDFGGLVAAVDSGVGRVTGLIGGLAALAGAGGLLASVGAGVKLAADMEQASVSFEVMIGSAQRAKTLLSSLDSFAASTPFELPGIVDATKKLIAFGVSDTQAVSTLRRIGDVASGIGVPLTELAEIYGKAKVQGRLMAEDVNQLTGRGIPIIQQFARQFGVAEGEVRGLVTAGRIGFPQLERAFIDMTSSGGQFFGMTDRQSRTLTGLWSTLTDTVRGALRRVAQQAIETFDFKRLVSLATGAIESFGNAVVPAVKSMAEWAKANVATFVTIGKVGLRLAELLIVGKVLGTLKNQTVLWAGTLATATQKLKALGAAAAAVRLGGAAPMIGPLTKGQTLLASVRATGGMAAAIAMITASAYTLDSAWDRMGETGEGYFQSLQNVAYGMTKPMYALVRSAESVNDRLTKMGELSNAAKDAWARSATAKTFADRVAADADRLRALYGQAEAAQQQFAESTARGGSKSLDARLDLALVRSIQRMVGETTARLGDMNARGFDVTVAIKQVEDLMNAADRPELKALLAALKDEAWKSGMAAAFDSQLAGSAAAAAEPFKRLADMTATLRDETTKLKTGDTVQQLRALAKAAGEFSPEGMAAAAAIRDFNAATVANDVASLTRSLADSVTAWGRTGAAADLAKLAAAGATAAQIAGLQRLADVQGHQERAAKIAAMPFDQNAFLAAGQYLQRLAQIRKETRQPARRPPARDRRAEHVGKSALRGPRQGTDRLARDAGPKAEERRRRDRRALAGRAAQRAADGRADRQDSGRARQRPRVEAPAGSGRRDREGVGRGRPGDVQGAGARARRPIREGTGG